jgi:hypothetical protein
MAAGLAAGGRRAARGYHRPMTEREGSSHERVVATLEGAVAAGRTVGTGAAAIP